MKEKLRTGSALECLGLEKGTPSGRAHLLSIMRCRRATRIFQQSLVKLPMLSLLFQVLVGDAINSTSQIVLYFVTLTFLGSYELVPPTSAALAT